jgi:hypothetical protein
MKHKLCLSEQDLILHHYGDHEHKEAVMRHLSSCPECSNSFASLQHDLNMLPEMDWRPDDLAGVRMAAKVREKRVSSHRRIWLPAIGASAVAALALTLTFSQSPPQNAQPIESNFMSTTTAHEFVEDMPDIEFLENLDLLKELDVLAQLEGV